MTPTELSATLKRLGWNRCELSRRLGLSSENTIRRWRETPPDVAEWLRRIVDAVEALPAPRIPTDRRKRPGGAL